MNCERYVTLTHQVEYWFNTKTESVEVGPMSLSLERIGPFATRAEAERALEIVAQRAKALREEEQQIDQDGWN